MVHRGSRGDFISVPRSSMPLRRRYESAASMDRFSEHSLHDEYLYGYENSNFWNDCLARVPYPTLIATIMCCLGVGVFCGMMFRGATLTSIMVETVFHKPLKLLDVLELVFASIGASMAALGFMIFCLGCLTTGATRHKVYRAWRSRVGGRITCVFFMTVTYILQIIWLLVFGTLCLIMFLMYLSYKTCNNDRVLKYEQCIDLKQFNFLFPNNTRPEDMEICGQQELKLFCKDYVEKTWYLTVIAAIANLLVILSLTHYLMCLAANYAHIRDHEKFQELQEIQYLQDPVAELDSPTLPHSDRAHHRSKDRF